LRVVGELGDGLMSVFNEQEGVVERHMKQVAEGAAKAGRRIPDDFLISALTAAAVLKPGERADSDRVVEQCGAWAVAALHFVYEIFRQTGDEEVVPESLHEVWDAYRAYVEEMKTPKEKRYLQIHNGHCTFHMAEERRFLTAKVIRASCLVGEPDELIARIRRLEKGGLHEVALLPNMRAARELFRDFAEHVIKRY